MTTSSGLPVNPTSAMLLRELLSDTPVTLAVLYVPGAKKTRFGLAADAPAGTPLPPSATATVL